MKDFNIGDLVAFFLLVLVVVGSVCFYAFVLHPIDEAYSLESTPIEVKDVPGDLPEEIPAEVIQEVEQKEEHKEPVLTDEEIIARVVYSESRGEKLIGQVFVAYTILNRRDYYGRTVESIVKEPNQYSYDESIKPTDTNYRAVIIAELVRDFLPDLLPDTMMWFANGGYHEGDDCGKPYIQVGNHYFNYLPESEETE